MEKEISSYSWSQSLEIQISEVITTLEQVPKDERNLLFQRVIFWTRQLVASLETGGSGSGATSLSSNELRLVKLCSSLTNLPSRM
jgi:hypothetical protein